NFLLSLERHGINLRPYLLFHCEIQQYDNSNHATCLDCYGKINSSKKLSLIDRQRDIGRSDNWRWNYGNYCSISARQGGKESNGSGVTFHWTGNERTFNRQSLLHYR